jgi:hypothetical protein
MPTYTFTVELQGSGNTQEEAWQDAIETFVIDPGEPQETFQDGDDFTDMLLDEDDDTDTLSIGHNNESTMNDDLFEFED